MTGPHHQAHRSTTTAKRVHRRRRVLAAVTAAFVAAPLAVTTPARAGTQSTAPVVTSADSTSRSCTANSPATTTCKTAVATTAGGGFELTAAVRKGVEPDRAVSAAAMTTLSFDVVLPRPTTQVIYYADVVFEEVRTEATSGVGFAQVHLKNQYASSSKVHSPGQVTYELGRENRYFYEKSWIPAQTKRFTIDLAAIAVVDGDLPSYDLTRCDLSPSLSGGLWYLWVSWALLDGRPCEPATIPNTIYVGEATAQVRGRIAAVRAVYEDGQVFNTHPVVLSVQDDDVTLRWDHAQGFPNEVTGYRLAKYDPASRTWVTQDLPAGTTNFFDPDEPRGETAIYQIAPRSGSDFGPGQQVYAYVPPFPPDAQVTGLWVTRTWGQICLAWDPATPDTRIERVLLFRTQSGSGVEEEIGGASSAWGSSFCDQRVQQGVEYTYVARGWNGGGLGPRSAKVTTRSS